MIDIHSHVLWGVDDGAKTLEDSLAMVEMAAAAGTTDIVATPHASPQYKFDPGLVQERAEAIRTGARDKGLALRLHTGCDFHLSFDNIQDALANPRKYTINNSRYLLVEFSDLLIFRNTADIFARMIEAGMTPIITHPERNPLLCQRLPELTTWCEAGALIQVTGQSFGGRFGRRAAEFARTLMDRGLVHFVASDGHDLIRRPPRLDEAFLWIQQHYDRDTAELVCVINPRAVLSGDLVFPAEPRSQKSSRKWYQLWR
ncbi:MAG: CpsB/CapC family capsule biosynthesis tyrosine phosphatase [Bryobacteraceae bacterium]